MPTQASTISGIQERIIKESQDVSESVLEEVLHYLQFLKSSRTDHPGDLLIASGSVLARDWLRPEEDEAWANL